MAPRYQLVYEDHDISRFHISEPICQSCAMSSESTLMLPVWGVGPCSSCDAIRRIEEMTQAHRSRGQ